MSFNISAGTTTWWRWPLVPLAAIGAAIAAGAAMSLFQWISMMMSWGSTNGWYFRFIVPIFVCGAAGYAYGWAACETAPRGGRFAGTVMTTILGILAAANIAFTWLLPKYSAGEAIQVTIGSAALTVAAIAAIIRSDR